MVLLVGQPLLGDPRFPGQERVAPVSPVMELEAPLVLADVRVPLVLVVRLVALV